MFDFTKIEDFSHHINLSIPNYNGLMDIVKVFISEYVQNGGTYVDIGCSDGRLIGTIPKNDCTSYIGIDIIDIRRYHDFYFIKDNVNNVIGKLGNVDLLTSIFSMQFMDRRTRRDLVSNIQVKMKECKCPFIVAEKVILNDSRVESVLKKRHIERKRLGFTDKEILDKEMDLFGSMFCLTHDQLKKELSSIGRLESIWQSYNFVAYIVTPYP